MPFFEFRCDACSQTFEKLLKNSDQTPGDCPKCGQSKLTRVFSVVSVGKATSAPQVAPCGNPNPGPGCGRCMG